MPIQQSTIARSVTHAFLDVHAGQSTDTLHRQLLEHAKLHALVQDLGKSTRNAGPYQGRIIHLGDLA